MGSSDHLSRMILLFGVNPGAAPSRCPLPSLPALRRGAVVSKRLLAEPPNNLTVTNTPIKLIPNATAKMIQRRRADFLPAILPIIDYQPMRL